MRLLSALKILQEINVPVLETGDAALKLGLSNAHASQVLRRLALEKHIIHLSRNFWVIDLRINLLRLPEYLTVPFPCYISLQTALYHHGMIDQIPRVITVVSLARTRLIKTTLADISVHHIIPEFFCDYEIDTKSQVKMASPEKALLDIFYLKPAKSLWFQSLPELEIPKTFNVKKSLKLIKTIPSKRRRTLVKEALLNCLSSDGEEELPGLQDS